MTNPRPQEIIPLALLTPQEHHFMGSSLANEENIIGENWYKPRAVESGGVSIEEAQAKRDSSRAYRLGFTGFILGRDDVVFRLQELDPKKGITIKDPVLGVMDKDGEFIEDKSLTDKFIELSKEAGSDLKLREGNSNLEREAPSGERK